MGWKTAQQKYKTGRALSNQKVEDLVARRVLKGLGLTAKQLPAVERHLLGQADFDKALWDRVHAVLRAVWLRQGGTAHFVRQNYRIEVCEDNAKHGLALARMTEALETMPENWVLSAMEPAPILLTRVKDTLVSLAFMPVWPQGNMQWLTPPLNVVAQCQDWWIIMQPTDKFIANLGTIPNWEDE
jgi:hypothetical protein